MERIRMDRVNAILKHKTYRKYYDQIEKIEKELNTPNSSGIIHRATIKPVTIVPIAIVRI